MSFLNRRTSRKVSSGEFDTVNFGQLQQFSPAEKKLKFTHQIFEVSVMVKKHKQFMPSLSGNNSIYRLSISWIDKHNSIISLPTEHYNRSVLEMGEDDIKDILDDNEEWKMSVNGINTTEFYNKENKYLDQGTPNTCRVDALISANKFSVTKDQVKSALEEGNICDAKTSITFGVLNGQIRSVNIHNPTNLIFTNGKEMEAFSYI